MIETTNLFYISNLNVIGGVETFIYELVRKYKDIDILVVYKTGHYKQIERIAENVRIIRYYEGMKFKCKKAWFNYETDLTKQVEAEEYIQIIHAMYKSNKITPKINPTINKYIAVSEGAAKEFEELTGIKCRTIRNPLQLLEEEKEPILFLVSATRLTPEKGKDRMEKLGKLLNEYGAKYLWLVFTNDTEAINNPNIVYIKPRLNVRQYLNTIKNNCYGVQLSDCEGDCYFTRECEMLGIPLLVTPVPSFKEQGLIDGKNCYYLPFDMKDIDIEKIVNHKPKYEAYIKEDQWEKELVNIKSTYKEEIMKTKLRCIRDYFDIKLQRQILKDEELIVDRKRAEELLNNPYNIVEFVEYIEEPKPKPEKAVKPKKKVTKR